MTSLILLNDAPKIIRNSFNPEELNVKINIDFTNPHECHYRQTIYFSNDRYITAIYTPPTGQPYYLRLNDREAALAKQLAVNHWLEVPTAKKDGESRKPISNLRQYGFCIATKATATKDQNREKVSLWRMIGHIKIAPIKEDLEGIQSIFKALPSIDKAEAMSLRRQADQALRRRQNTQKKTQKIKRRRN
jgi:hypothetical protein